MTYTPLERAALDGLAWELSRQAPDLAGQIEESLPSRRRVHGPIFFTETIVDRRRPDPAETTTGRLGTIHVQIDHLEHPVAFQIELAEGRLIALHGDAYGQDLTAVDLAGDVVDQVFRLDEDGRAIAFDSPARTAAILEASPLRRLQANPDPPESAPGLPPPEVASNAVLDMLFGKKDRASSEAAAPPSDDEVSIRIGVVALAVVLALFLIFVLDLNPIFAAIPAFWLARALLTKRAVAEIARMVAARPK